MSWSIVFVYNYTAKADFSFENTFKSRQVEEQQVLSRSTLPVALMEVYGSCDPPPHLNDLTPYRDDGKLGLKFYTDPNYFYDLWVEQQSKALEKKKRRVRREGKEEREGG